MKNNIAKLFGMMALLSAALLPLSGCIYDGYYDGFYVDGHHHHYDHYDHGHYDHGGHGYHGGYHGHRR